MLLRTLLTLVNLATIGVAVAVLLAYPAYSNIAFYFLLGWMFISLALMYSPRASRPVTTPASPGMTVTSASPLASSAGHEHASSIGFCMYCAAPLAPGTDRCPACGRTLPHFA
jgi:hypothetical protein